jgi:putative ABC transport system permease protein
MLSRTIAYLRGLWRRRAIASEADEELAFHVQHETEANIARGMSPANARREALRSIGGLAQTADAIRDVRRTTLDAIWRDVRHAIRSLSATPTFTAVAAAVLTLSIGATTAIYSVVDAVMLRALPFPEAHRLVAVGERHIRSASQADQNLVAPQNFTDWRAQQDVFTGLAAVGYASISVRPEGGREPETLETQAVTADFFPVLGVAPQIGRTFTRDNEVDRRARVAVISHGLWQRRFGGAADVVGRHLPGQLGDFEILGVMPPSFAYPVGAMRPTEVWIPNVFRPDDRVRANSYSYRLQVIGRLRDGVSHDQAQARMDQITAALAAETPRWFEDRTAKVERLDDYLTRGVRTWMVMLLAAVAFVLLIACVNLANLMLVRASARRRELAIRSALGASRVDLARSVLIESLLLSLGGTALGVGLAWAGVEVLRAAMPPEVPRVAAVVVDLRVLAAMALVAVVSGLIFSAAPVIQFCRPLTGGAMALAMRARTPTPAHQWLRGTLVTLEVALAVVLLVGAGLFLASFARVTSVDLGLNPHDVLAVYVRPLTGAHNWETAQQRNRGLLDNILESVRAMPGVEAAALVSGGVPLRGDLRTIEFSIPGRVLPPDEDLDFNEISPDYFRVLGVPLVGGRFFDEKDRQGSEPVVIINDAAARKYFPEGSPIGRIVEFQGARRIVGVVGSIRHDGPETEWREQGFIPVHQSRAVAATLVLRLAANAGDVLPAVKSAVWAQFPDLALPDIQTLSGYLSKLIAARRFNMLLLTLFAVLAVVIGCVGIYGVMAYVVTLRTQEIGIRLALGAMPAAILKNVLGRALIYLLGGLAIGLAAAAGLATLVSSFLFETQPHDPWVYAGVAATLIATGIVAALFPARRAAKVDPLIALRVE